MSLRDPRRRIDRHHLHRRNARRLGLAFWTNVTLAIAWTAMVPVTLITGLKSSVPFLAVISIYALIASHSVGAIASLAGKASNESAAKLHAAETNVRPGGADG